MGKKAKQEHEKRVEFARKQHNKLFGKKSDKPSEDLTEEGSISSISPSNKASAMGGTNPPMGENAGKSTTDRSGATVINPFSKAIAMGGNAGKSTTDRSGATVTNPINKANLMGGTNPTKGDISTPDQSSVAGGVATSESPAQVAGGGSSAPEAPQSFFEKNKMPILIGGGVFVALLGIGIIVKIRRGATAAQ